MRKFFYTFAFILCALMTLQAETMVVATYNLRNANGSDSTLGTTLSLHRPDRTVSRVRYLWNPRGQISAIAGLEASHARIRLYRRGT